MKEIIKVLKDYQNAYEQIQETYKQAEDYIKANYVPESMMYKSSLGTAVQTKIDALKPLMDKSKGSIGESLKSAKERLQKAIVKQPTEEQLKIIELLKSGILTDTEKAMMIDSVKGNYIATKMMHQAMGTQMSSPVESILEALTKVEKWTSQYFEYDGTPSNSYDSKVLMNENGYLNQVDEEIKVFLETYSGQESEE